MIKLICIMLLLCSVCLAIVSDINLPMPHLPIYYKQFPEAAIECKSSSNCKHKNVLNSSKCWGYEPNCSLEFRYSNPSCPGHHRGWVKSKIEQISTFYDQADFGYIKQQRDELKVLCEPQNNDDSTLECSDHMRFCRGRNILVNFTKLNKNTDPIRYKMDVLAKGDIGGYCKVNQHLLNSSADHISPLQSWGPEIRNFVQLPDVGSVTKKACDITVEKATYFMKIDATVNMYHHFCDFFNLYTSMHVNANKSNTFSTDNYILIWESYTYRSSFASTWEAFTQHPILDLKTFMGKTVCFKDIVFPLLPRMIFGLYYNTPLIYGCENSGLFHAFSQHVLHRLQIPLHRRRNSTIRITLLSRQTKFRRILNEDELIAAISNQSKYHVEKVMFTSLVPFKQQLEVIRNTDILIGMHGAGLTHLLFLPDWATVFELYNCEDVNCYFDLSRLRGLKYVTWRKVDKLQTVEDGSHEGASHAKFANYIIDVNEFVKLVEECANYVRNNDKFLELDSSRNEREHSEL